MKALGQLELLRTEKSLPTRLDRAPSDLRLIENQPPTRHIAYAQATATPFERDGFIGDVVYRISTEKLHQGLKRAFEMGKQMTEEAEANSRGWEVYRIDTAFDMSISGNLFISLLNGDATTRISWMRTN